MESKTKQCQNCQKDFRIAPEDFEFYQKIDVPEPTFCPECRAQRRMIWRNEKNLYKRKCDFSNKEVFSILSPKIPVKVYDYNIWWSDKWDPMEYGREYDFTKTFFEQLKELRREVPWVSRPLAESVNCDYCMNSGFLKNCYLVFSSSSSENCAYGINLNYSKDCYDNSYLTKCELCHEGFMLSGCYKVFFSSNCTNCQEVYFSSDCVNCQNCFSCANLRHKKYHIFNKPYTKEEYFKKLKRFDFGSYGNVLSFNKESKEFWLKFPVKFMHGRKNINVTGEDIYDSKNVFDSYSIKKGENLKYCQFMIHGPESQDCHDYTLIGWNAKLVYECAISGRGFNRVKFCCDCWPDCRNLEYCLSCHSSSHLFGCVGLRHKQYCILNKQYTKEEYEELVPKIKQQMNDLPYTDKKGRIYQYGEFFPIELSPFAYNETIAQEYFPLTKEQALKQGYRWYDKPKPEYQATLKANDIPDHIKDIDESILKEVIECQNKDCSGSTVFRLIPPELQFYQKHTLPIPRLCPDCRHHERIKQRNPMKLWHRKCMNKPCPNEFETTYAPDRQEIVYCESCYQKEVE